MGIRRLRVRGPIGALVFGKVSRLVEEARVLNRRDSFLLTYEEAKVGSTFYFWLASLVPTVGNGIMVDLYPCSLI